MGQSFTDTKNLILTRKNVLITLPGFANNDSFLAGCALFLTLKKIFDQNQNSKVDILIPAEITKTQRNLAGGNLIKYFKKELESVNYILNIPHEDGAIEKVSFRDEGDSLKFFITPSFGELFIDKIKIDQVGANYDLVILVGFSKISALKNVYEKNKLFFDNSKKLIIGKSSAENGCVSLVIDESLSISETVFSLLKELDSEIQPDASQMLLNGIINKSGSRIQNIKSRITLNVISELLDNGASMELLNSGGSKSKTYAQLQLLQKVYANIRQDSAGVLWSTIRNFELREMQIDDADINIDEPIQFNFCEGYKHVFVLYELSDGSVVGRIEADDMDVSKLINECRFNENGDAGIFIADRDLEVVEKLILKKLGATDLSEFENLGVSKGETIEDIEKRNGVMTLLPVTPKKELVKNAVKKQGQIRASPTKGADDDADDDYLSTPIVDEGNGANFGPPQIFGTNNMGRQMGGY